MIDYNDFLNAYIFLMKKIIQILTLLVAFVGLPMLSNAQSVDVQFAFNETASDCDNNLFCVDIEIKSDDGANLIGTSSIRFTYDNSVLSFPGGISTAPAGYYTSINFDDDQTTLNPECDAANGGPGGTSYQAHGFDGSVSGDFLITMVKPGDFSVACPDIATDWEDVSTICFDILDPTGNPNMAFQGVQNGQPTSTALTNFNPDNNDPSGKYDNGTFTDLTTSIDVLCGACDHTIPLVTGWNIMSTYCDPTNPNMLTILSPISSQVILVKNEIGLTCIPQVGINNIGNWIVDEGYQIRTNSATSFTINGNKVDPTTTPLQLASGWNLIAYLRDTPQDASTSWAGIPSVILAKDYVGLTYIPSVSINNIGNLVPGQGYQMRVGLASTTSTYPPKPTNDDEPIVFHSSQEVPEFFVRDFYNTGNNAVLLLMDPANETVLRYGDEIGIFSEDNVLLGSAVYEDYHTSITFWGDDNTTDEIDGFLAGEPFIVKVWNQETNEVKEVPMNYTQGTNIYEKDGFYIADIFQEVVSTGLGEVGTASIEAYPNPTNAELILQVKTLSEGPVSVQIYDMQGKLLEEISNQHLTAGTHFFKYNVSPLSAGLYLAKVVKDGMIQTDKFTVIK